MSRTLSALAAILCISSAWAGDRDAILEALDQIEGNWPEASLKTRLTGLELGEIVLGNKITFGYEAAVPGHVTIVLVDSHGAISLTRDPRNPAPRTQGAEVFATSEPLGTQSAYLLYSQAPLDTLFSGRSDVELGDQMPAATALVAQVAGERATQKLAISKLQYLLVAKAGDTEHTTKGIIREVLEQDADYAPGSPPPQPAASGSAVPGPPVASVAAPPARIPARIEFAFDSAELTPQGRRDLDTFGEALLSAELRDRPVFLEGHTDNVGDEAYNCALSRRRAQAAERYLAQAFGVKADRIAIFAYGEGRPLGPNDTEQSRNQNRRVDFVFGRPGQAYAPQPAQCN